MSKKVLLISNMVYHYRVPVYNYLNRRLLEIDRELVVATCKLQDANPHKTEFELVEIPFGFRRYMNLVRDCDPAVVMLFLHIKDLMVWPLLAWMKCRRTRIIYWNHGINLETPDNRIKNWVFGRFHANADAIVLYSENEKKYIASRHQKKVFVANNTINFDTIPEIPESKMALKQKWNIGFERIVLFVGRIKKNKRLDDLLSAAALLDAGTGIVIVGGGLSEEQRARIDSADNVHYLGEIYAADKVNEIFKMSDVFSIPGKMGLGLNQAFFWGLPVITQNVRHSPEISYLKEGENGFIVPANDIPALAKRINEVLVSGEKYLQYSRNARDTIVTEASIDRMCDGFVNAVQYAQHNSR